MLERLTHCFLNGNVNSLWVSGNFFFHSPRLGLIPNATGSIYTPLTPNRACGTLCFGRLRPKKLL